MPAKVSYKYRPIINLFGVNTVCSFLLNRIVHEVFTFACQKQPLSCRLSLMINPQVLLFLFSSIDSAMLSQFSQTVNALLRVFFLLCSAALSLHAQCPDLDNSATLTSPDCVVGTTNCDLCPGDVMTLSGSGSGLQPGSCIDWYYGTTANFNPYNNQGNFMGCSLVEVLPVSPCVECPFLLSLFINACGTEQNNEYMVVWSGSGFTVDDMTVDFDDNNNTLGPQNDDIGPGGCSWEEPNANAVASVQTICPNATVVGAGPGETVPAGVPIIVFTSDNYDENYNFGGLCPLAPVIYVMQNGCGRSIGAFTNTGNGDRTTVVGLDCGCTSELTYNLADPSNNNGDFVIWTPFFPVHGNVGCGFPNIPSFPGGGGGNPFSAAPFDYTVPAALCGGGPYWVVGVADPLPTGCAQTFTNYMPFNVPCPPPNLGSDDVCELDGAYNLTQLEDPNLQGGGTWSGPGVSGSFFDPVGLSGTVVLTFTPNSDCSQPSTTTIDILPAPTVTINPFNAVCAGGDLNLTVNLTGTGPWTFEVFADGNFVDDFFTNTTPFTFTINPTDDVVISIDNYFDALCTGTPASVFVNVLPAAATATMPNGASTICSGDSLVLDVLFTGQAPFTFEYAYNGITQAPAITTSNSPYFWKLFPPDGITVVTLVSVLDAGGCPGQVFGEYTVNAVEKPTAVLSGSDTICFGQMVDLMFEFTGEPEWGASYTANGVLQPVYSTFDTPDVLSVTPASSTLYEITGVVSDGGCAGTVSGTANVVMLPTPNAALQSGNQAVCIGELVDLMVTLSGAPLPITFSYAVNGIPLDTILADSLKKTITIIPQAGNNVVTLGFVTNGACNGTVSGSYTIVGTPVVNGVLSGTDTICENGVADLTVTFTGNPPFQFIYTANGANPDTVVTSNNPYILSVNPDTNTIYQLTGVSGIGCPGTASGTATVTLLDSLGGTISGGGQICQNGSGTNIIFTFTGVGPFTFTYRDDDGIVYGPITTSNTVFTIPVNPPNGVTFFLYSLSNGICDGNLSGFAQVSVFSPSTAQMFGSSAHCFAADTFVYIDFTGSGPFEYVYSIDGVAQPPVFTFDDPDSILVITNTTQIYTLLSVNSPGCIGTVLGSATVTINGAPNVSNVVQNCNFAAGNYTVSFQINNGVPPYTLTCGAGTFSGNVFTSAPIPINDPHQFCFLDANGCDTIVVADQSKCNCTTNAGTMDLDTLNGCTGETLTAVFNNNGVLDPNDTLGFILHDNTAFPFGNVLAYNNTPIFGFLPGMTTGFTYRISAVAGNNNGMGQVDLNDPCLSVSTGTPVVFNPIPQVVVGAIDTVCADPGFLLPVTLNGNAPFTLTYSVNGQAPVSVPNLPGPVYNLSLPLSVNVLLELSIADAVCGNPAVDTTAITVAQTPSWGIVTETCDQIANTYTLSAPLNGFAPFSVSGLGGVVNGNQFTADPQANALPYLAILTDVAGCGADTLSGITTCGCISDAGTLVIAPALNGCGISTVTATHNGDQVLDPNDVFYFVLHTGPGNALGTVLDSSTTPNFTFLPGIMAFGTTYFISAVVENGVITPDPCRSVSAGVPVVWRDTPTAQISGNADICLGQSTPITIAFTGTAPFNVGYTRNGVQNTAIANQSPFIINTTLLDTSLFLLTTVSDAFCPGTVSGSALVTPHSVPQVQAINTNCAPGNTTYSVSFTVTQADLASVTVTGLPAGVYDAATGLFTSGPIPVTDAYSYVVRDIWDCGQDTASGSVICCSTSSGTMNQTPQTLCNDSQSSINPPTGIVLEPGDTLLYYLVDDPAAPWVVLAVSTTPTFSFLPATMQSNVPYTVLAVAGAAIAGGVDLNDPCLSVTQGPQVTWLPPVTASLDLLTDSICTGSVANLGINLSGGTSYQVVWAQNGAQNTVTTNNSLYLFSATPPFSGTTYNLVSVSAGGCTGTVDGSVETVFVETPFQIVNVQTVCDAQQVSFVLQFDVENGAAPDPTYTVSGISGTFTGTTFTSNPLPVAGGYNVTVTSSTGCTAVVSGTVSCTCATEAGSVNVVPTMACTTDTLFLTPGGDAQLEPGDGLQYVLFADINMPFQSILAINSVPEFTFLSNMTAGVTYYVAAVAGNLLPDGSIDQNDPCLSLSAAPVSVQFREPPTALFAGDTSLCPGDNVVFCIQFTGKAPFDFTFSLNGNVVTQQSPGPVFCISSTNVQQPQTYIPLTVSDQNCAGTVNGSVNINLSPIPSVDLSQDATICEGKSATLTITLNSAPGASFDIVGGPAPIPVANAVNGQTISVTPLINTTYSVANVVVAPGLCSATTGKSATISLSDLSGNLQATDYNGFGVSCEGSADGTLTVTPVGGQSPVSAQWSNSATALTLEDLPAGAYSITLTDAAGCTWTESISMDAPSPLEPLLTIENAGCADEENGVILVDTVLGGVAPFLYTLNGNPLVNPEALNLPAGVYTLEITDANGCAYEEMFDIISSPTLLVEAGPDVTVALGEFTILNPLVNSFMLTDIQWRPDSTLSKLKELRTFATPTVNTEYFITVEDVNGCTATDSILVIVQNKGRVYIPNVFNPGLDDGNERFTVYAGPELRNVRLLKVFDRWGEIVYEGQNIEPNMVTLGWDGNWKDLEVIPGVYIYVAELEFIDGTTEMRSGDVTVVR